MKTAEQDRVFEITLTGAERLEALAKEAQSCGLNLIAEFLRLEKSKFKQVVAAQQRQLNGAAEPFVVV